MEGFMSESVVERLDLATPTSKEIAPASNIMDFLDLASISSRPPSEPIFVGYHGTSIGDIANLQSGIDGSLTGASFFGGYSQYRKQGFYVAEDSDVAEKFARNRVSSLNSLVMQEKQLPSWINSKNIEPVVAEVFIPRCLFNFGVDGYANLPDLKDRLKNRHLIINQTTLPNGTKLWDQATETKGKGTKATIESIKIGNRNTMVSGPIDDPEKKYQHQGSAGPETAFQHFFPAVSARWLVFGKVRLCK